MHTQTRRSNRSYTSVCSQYVLAGADCCSMLNDCSGVQTCHAHSLLIPPPALHDELLVVCGEFEMCMGADGVAAWMDGRE